MDQEKIQPKAEFGEPIILQLFRIVSTQTVRRCDTGDNRHLMRVDKRPRTREAGMIAVATDAVQDEQEGYHEQIMSVRVTELVPPIFRNC